MTVYTLFGQPATPATLTADAQPYTMGVQFSVSSAAVSPTLSGIWFYSAPSAVDLPGTIALYAVAGASLVHSETPSWSGAVGSGWVRSSFASPPALTAATDYKACVLQSAAANWYAATANYWTSGPGASGITSGPVTAPNSAGGDGGQDTFTNSGTIAYPATSFNGGNYWVDPEITATVTPPPTSSVSLLLGQRFHVESPFDSEAETQGAGDLASASTASTLPQFPTGTSVGYENAVGYPGSLTDGSGITVASNTTYRFLSNPGNGSVGADGAPVSNVTFYGCAFSNSGINAIACLCFGTNLTFINCTFQPAPLASFPPSAKNSPVAQLSGVQYGLCADGTQASPGTFNSWASGLTIKNCDFWGFGNGGARLANGSTQANPFIVHYSYIHNLRLNTSTTDHQDGIGAPGGGDIAYLQLTNNTINTGGDTNAIIWGAANSAVSHLLIDGNLLGGYGFNVALLNAANNISNVTFTNNTFTTQLQCFFGPLYDQTILSAPGLIWRGNKWLVPNGAYWGHAQYNGYFWVPGYTSLASPTLDELAAGLVSTTDYM